MTSQEFENYLVLLSRLLRVGPRERERMAEEFRSHMEDRLDDLLARGVPRDEAVRQSLEEFGDAAGLAAEFVSISRNRRNRWIMRLTSISLAATILIAAGIFTFWPGGNAGPGRATVVAQDPTRPAPGGIGTDAGIGGVPAPPSLDDKLKHRMDAEFVETPLKDTIDFLADKNDIQFIIKNKRLEEAGVSLDVPITLRLKNVRLSTLLDVMLEEINLVYTEKDDLIVITTPDDALATMEVRVYDCRDLLTMPTVGQARPGMMMPGGGVPGGDIPSGPPGLGTPDGLRPGDSSAPGFDPGSSFPGGLPGGIRGGVPAPGGGRDPSGNSRGGFGSLDGLPDAGVPTLGRARPDILPQLVGEGGGAAGLGGLAPGVAGGPLPGAMGGGLGGAMGGEQRPQRPMTAEELKAEQLMNIITTAVDPSSWADVGSTGTIGEYNGLIVISQSARTHSKIEKVLDMLREAASLPKSKTPRVVR